MKRYSFCLDCEKCFLQKRFSQRLPLSPMIDDCSNNGGEEVDNQRVAGGYVVKLKEVWGLDDRTSRPVQPQCLSGF